jgi:hypothetical protein
MQIIFNIIAVTTIIGLILKWFSKCEQSKLLWLLLSVIIIKLFIVIGWYIIAGDNLDDVWVDTYYYDWAGQYLANYFRDFIFYKTSFMDLFGSYIGSYYYIGIIYTLFDHYPLMVSIINTLAGIVIAILIYKIAVFLFDRKIAKWTFIFNLFYPYYIHISYYLLRDMLVTFLVVTSTWNLLRTKTGQVRYYLFLISSIFVLYFVRSPLAIILLGLCGLHLIFEFNFGHNKILKTLFVTIVSIFLFVGFSGFIQPSGRTAFEKITDIRIEETESTASFLEDAQGIEEILSRVKANPLAFLKHSLRDTILIFWGPFYFCSSSGPALFHKYGRFIFWENLRSLFMFFLMPMVIYGGYHCFRYKKKETFIFYSFTVTLIFILMFMGNVLRWGLPMMPFVLMFGAVGVTYFNKIKPFYLIYILMLNLLVFMNATLKESTIMGLSFAAITLGGILFSLIRSNNVFCLPKLKKHRM